MFQTQTEKTEHDHEQLAFMMIRVVNTLTTLNKVTLGQHISDNNNRMITLTVGFYVLFRYNGTGKYLNTIAC